MVCLAPSWGGGSQTSWPPAAWLFAVAPQDFLIIRQAAEVLKDFMCQEYYLQACLPYGVIDYPFDLDDPEIPQPEGD